MPRRRQLGTWPALALLAASLAGCGEGGETAARAAAGSSGRTKGTRSATAALSEPCTLITPADIERISSYAGAVRREVSSDSVCWWTVDGQRLGVSISVGRYVPTPFLGGSEVDLGGGLRGRRSDAGWLNQVILADGTAITLILDGTALASGGAKGEYLFARGDGREVDLREQYEAYAQQIVERLR